MIYQAATAREQRAKRRWKTFGLQSASIWLRNPRLQNVLARGSHARKSAFSSMPKLPGVNHLAAVRALANIGFVIIRLGKISPLSMACGRRKVRAEVRSLLTRS